MHYFQSIHSSDIFEVRGVQTENIQNRMVSQNSLNETINFNLSCAVALYSLCYSIMIKIYMYSLLFYNERDTSRIQYTKNINGTASHVDAIRKIQEKYNTPG